MKPQKISGKEQGFLERELREFAKSKGWPGRVARELGKKIPSHKNMIRAVRISPEHVFVFRFPPDISLENSPLPVDIFTLKSAYLGTAELPDIPLFISRQAFYLVKADESGNVYLQKMGYSLVF
jgi:hypothetical protein